MTTMTAPDIPTQLAEARRSAQELRTEFDRADGELRQAVEALDYGTANALKRRTDELRPALILADNHVLALEATAKALADHEAQLHAAEREKARQDACDVAVAEAMAGEQAATEEAAKLLAEANEALRTVAAKLRAATAAEGTAGHYRQAAHQAQVDAGRQQHSPFGLAMPNRVRCAIDESRVFPEILRTTS